MNSTSDDVIANQIFLGIPWKNIKKRYEQIADDLNKKYPLSFIIIGRNDDQDAEDLLEIILEKLDSSSYAIFDATSGNANVSLEYGYAEAQDIPRALYLSEHKASKRKPSDSAIIADLAGKKRNQYKNIDGLKNLLVDFSKKHAYTIKFERFLGRKFRTAASGEKKRLRTLALKVIHEMDNKRQVRRADIIQNLQADQANYKPAEIDSMVRALHGEKLIQSQQGPHAKVHVAYE